MEEIFKPLVGAEERYKVSNKGRVVNLLTGKYLLPQLDSRDRYVQYHITASNGVTTKRLAHRLVAEAFLPNPENKTDVHHIDGNTRNNDLSNLAWTTHKENVNDPATIERFRDAKSSPIILIDIETGTEIKFRSAKDAGRSDKVPMNQTSISNHMRGERLRCGNYYAISERDYNDGKRPWVEDYLKPGKDTLRILRSYARGTFIELTELTGDTKVFIGVAEVAKYMGYKSSAAVSHVLNGDNTSNGKGTLRYISLEEFNKRYKDEWPYNPIYPD